MKKKLFSGFLCMILLLSLLTGCNSTPAPSGKGEYLANQEYIYGMDYIVWEKYHSNKLTDYSAALQTMKNLGVKSIRHWMHTTWFIDSDFEYLEDNVSLMKEMIAEIQKQGIQIVGMSHQNINKYNAPNAKVSPSSSYYAEFLQNYEKGWYMLAQAFPEIDIWEIDNETNNADFMPNAEDGSAFTLEEMAHISTDLFYYGSRGVHRANPDATTVMGGLVTWNIHDFLDLVYANIASGEFGEGSTNPDDYFQAFAWHPYTDTFNAESFKRENDEIYAQLMEYEKTKKKVYLTEVGMWTAKQSASRAAEYVKALYTVLGEMPYVESAHYYLAFDNMADNGNTSGLFHDPDWDKKDLIRGTANRAHAGSPKLAAYAYQEIAGGSGSLRLVTHEVDGGSYAVPNGN